MVAFNWFRVTWMCVQNYRFWAFPHPFRVQNTAKIVLNDDDYRAICFLYTLTVDSWMTSFVCFKHGNISFISLKFVSLSHWVGLGINWIRIYLYEKHFIFIIQQYVWIRSYFDWNVIFNTIMIISIFLQLITNRCPVVIEQLDHNWLIYKLIPFIYL